MVTRFPGKFSGVEKKIGRKIVHGRVRVVTGFARRFVVLELGRRCGCGLVAIAQLGDQAGIVGFLGRARRLIIEPQPAAAVAAAASGKPVPAFQIVVEVGGHFRIETADVLGRLNQTKDGRLVRFGRRSRRDRRNRLDVEKELRRKLFPALDQGIFPFLFLVFRRLEAVEERPQTVHKRVALGIVRLAIATGALQYQVLIDWRQRKEFVQNPSTVRSCQVHH